MPIQIDRMDTSIELTAPTTPAAPAGERRPSPTTPGPTARTALAELMGQVMSDELECFLRNRGM